MASPQTENGYTPVANEILDHIVQLKLNGTQFRIIMAVWRYTYGFSRKEHGLSESFLSKAIGVSRRNLIREIKPLFDMKLLIMVKSATFSEPAIIKFNKNFDEWEQLSNMSTGVGLDTRCQNSAKTGVGLDTQENKYKTNKTNTVDFYFNQFWQAYPKKVNKAGAEKSFKRLKVNEKQLDIILFALEKEKLSEQWRKDNGQFIPYPTTWLNQHRWESEYVPPSGNAAEVWAGIPNI